MLEARHEAQTLRGRSALAQQLRRSAGLERGPDAELQSAVALMESSVGRRYREHLPEKGLGVGVGYMKWLEGKGVEGSER